MSGEGEMELTIPTIMVGDAAYSQVEDLSKDLGCAQGGDILLRVTFDPTDDPDP